jgi:hypothetical protein
MTLKNWTARVRKIDVHSVDFQTWLELLVGAWLLAAFLRWMTI